MLSDAHGLGNLTRGGAPALPLRTKTSCNDRLRSSDLHPGIVGLGGLQSQGF